MCRFCLCIGWSQTLRRLRTFQFSPPFAISFKDAFAVIPGNPTGFDAGDLTDRKIGFLDGFVSDSSCLARQVNITVNIIVSVSFTLRSFFEFHNALWPGNKCFSFVIKTEDEEPNGVEMWVGRSPLPG